jgi:cell division protein FtsI/penicillin-binding protein 2
MFGEIVYKIEYAINQLLSRLDKLTREQQLLLFFAILTVILLGKLFVLQVVEKDYWGGLLLNQHYTRSELKAKRGQLFLTDKSGKAVQLTENVTFFNLFVDPKFVNDKERLIEVLTPIVYDHLCSIYGLETVTEEKCVKNIEMFTDQVILPERQ